MAEWSKAAVLKTVEGNTSVGSNPTPSAIKLLCNFISAAVAIAAEIIVAVNYYLKFLQ